MSDLSKLKEVLDHQSKRANWKEWSKLTYEVSRLEDHIDLIIRDMEVGFVFTLHGRLKGAYNWKE